MAPIEEVKQQSGKFFKIITDNFSKFKMMSVKSLEYR